MKKIIITNGFDKMSESKIEVRAGQIIAAMTGNVNFPTPNPTIPEMSVAYNDFVSSLADCRTGDRLKIAIKNQYKATLIDMLHEWANYVLFISDNDEAIALSSNFSIGKTSQPSPSILKPENLRVVNGINSGELINKINRVLYNRGYLFQYTTDAMLALNKWEIVPSTKTSCIIANLEPGVKYHCRVAAMGINNQLVYSDTISRIVA